MKWAYSTENKIKASLTLLLLCGVVMFSNYRLEKLSGKVAASVQSIYEDRLVVQDLIFSYGQILDDLQAINNAGQSKLNNVLLSKEAVDLEKKYLSTVMTDEEEQVFKSFAQNINTELVSSQENSKEQVSVMRNKLERLEQIQMEEARSQLTLIQQAQGSQKLGFYVETAILVVLLVIVQGLVISNSGMQKIIKKESMHLN